MYLNVKILVNTLFLSGLIVQSNINMASNLVLTEMFTITEKSAILKNLIFGELQLDIILSRVPDSP